jgi:hypothetical protein
MSTARKSDTSIRGIKLKFSVSIKNTGARTIESVQWAYLFHLHPAPDLLVYVFTTRIKIAPGQEKTLKDDIPSQVLPTNQKAPTAQNSAQSKDRVIILRLDYADGSSWHSSSHH